MIHFEFLNKKELLEFINSGRYAHFPFLPTTEHRAWSQIKNPKADEEDILLTLAFYEKKLAGYLGTLPATLEYDGKEIKYAWLSTLYVNENFRGKKIAQKILETIFEKYEGKIAMTEFTPEAENLYLKTEKFQYIPPKIGYRFYIKSDTKRILTYRKPSLEKWNFILGTFDDIANSGIRIFYAFQKTKKIKVEMSQKVDEESTNFLSSFSKNRTPDELTWIMQNPWVLEGDNADERYLFSSFSKKFDFFWVKIFDENNHIETVAMLQLRDGHLKIPYLFYKKNLAAFKNFLITFSKENALTTITSYQKELNEELKKDFPKIWKKKLERRYLFHKNLIEQLPKPFQNTFQDGDGDCVFT